MSPEDFVYCMRKEVLEQNLDIYKNILASDPGTGGNVNEWSTVLRVYDSMNNNQKAAIISMARIAIVDTISTLLGIIDGTVILNTYRDAFTLAYGTVGEKLNGELQDYFLAADEDHD